MQNQLCWDLPGRKPCIAIELYAETKIHYMVILIDKKLTIAVKKESRTS
jgi:hypothetical protein